MLMPKVGRSSGASGLPLRILIAEDTRVPATRMKRMLEGLGYVVIRAQGNTAVLEKSIEQHFDLIFMDAEMLPMDGPAITKDIRAHERVHGGHVPVIAMSPQAITAVRGRCLEAGMDRYISKPSNTPELRIVLQAFFDPDSIHETDRPSLWKRTAVMERAGGDEKSLHRLLEVFANESPRLLGDMKGALLAQQSDLLEAAALNLGEELSYVGAVELSCTARELALLAKIGDFSGAAELAVGLQSRLLQMESFMVGTTL